MAQTQTDKEEKPRWPSEIFEVLKEAEISQISYVPDAGHSDLIKFCLADNRMKTTRLTTEEEGVALSLGAWLGGDRSALLMQSSGVGNCINMLSIIQETRSPLLMLVTMRGEWGEFNPWQLPMGQGAPGALEAMGVTLFRVERAEDVSDTVNAAAAQAFHNQCSTAVLLSQRLIGAKGFK